MKNVSIIPGPNCEAHNCSEPLLTEMPDGLAPDPRDSGFPFHGDTIDTFELWQVVPLMFGKLMSLFSYSGIKRGAAAHIWKLHTHLGEIYREEIKNFNALMLAALRGDPDWQREVYADLGGVRAVRAWKRRAERAGRPPLQKLESDRPRVRSQAGRNPTGVKTDRYGLFCWAKVSREREMTSQDRTAQTFRPRTVGRAYLRPKPIPVTPDDLEPCVKAELGHNQVKLNGDMLLTIWSDIQTRLQVWNARLVMLDMALTCPRERQHLFPP